MTCKLYSDPDLQIRNRHCVSVPFLGGSHVLVVDDTRIFTDVLVMFIERLGATCRVVPGGMDAVHIAQCEHFDLAVIDYNIGDTTGAEVTRLIRAALSAASTFPIIGMSGDHSDEIRGVCLAAGMDDWLAKPFRFEAFAALLGKWLAMSTPREV